VARIATNQLIIRVEEEKDFGVGIQNPAASVVQLIRTSSIMRVVMSLSPD